MSTPTPGKKWPPSATWTLRALVALCAVLGLLDLTYDKHVHYPFEDWFGFYGVYGFISCVALVLIAKELRKVLMRDEDYYD